MHEGDGAEEMIKQSWMEGTSMQRNTVSASGFATASGKSCKIDAERLATARLLLRDGDEGDWMSLGPPSGANGGAAVCARREKLSSEALPDTAAATHATLSLPDNSIS
eukprot:4860022-Amphidinium_carterae.1